MANNTRSSWVRPALLALAGILLVAGVIATVLRRETPPFRSSPIRARLELAAGTVTVSGGDQGPHAAVSGTPIRAGSKLETAAGARALLRLPDGSSAFLRGGSAVTLGDGEVTLTAGEYWLEVPALQRAALLHRVGDIAVSAVNAGLSLRRSGDGVGVYVARGMAVVNGPSGRVEVNAGEQATVAPGQAPAVAAVAFWDDWTGGLADFETSAASPGAGAGTVYGIDQGAPAGSPAQRLIVKRQSVRAVLRDGLSETEVDQTFFNPSPRDVEGWYWFVVPPGASVSGFALETDGHLIEGEFIEKKAASTKYSAAKASGHAPAILEWVDGRTYRARIFPIKAGSSRRIVVRYLQLSPVVDGKLSYVYPMGRGASTRVGEFSLAVELGEQGRNMTIATLDDARIEDGGVRVTMRRSGFTPRVDFQLEAQLNQTQPALRVSRFTTGSDGADYIMARYTPQVDWGQVAPPKADVVVVVDTSADGDDATRRLRNSAAEAILRALADDDHFALVSLDVKATVLHPQKGLAAAKDDEIAHALERLAEHPSGGATDMAALFDAALTRVHGAEQPAIVYVGDGLATSGEMSGEQLLERLRRALGTSRARLFTVGVGAHSDRALLGELARAGGGAGFSVDVNSEATARALQLVAAIKVPTITEFELDLGAGLDEPFTNLTGKVPQGSDVLLLARTHHALPAEAQVRGRLNGKPFSKKIAITDDKSVLTAFVPRLWAAAYVQRLLGASAGAQAERGRIIALGIDYGLVTPFTSVLALESEQAYRRMHIRRHRGKLRGVRLGALDTRSERNIVSALHPRLLAPNAFGCDASAHPDNEIQPSLEEDGDIPVRHKDGDDANTSTSRVGKAAKNKALAQQAPPSAPEPTVPAPVVAADPQSGQSGPASGSDASKPVAASTHTQQALPKRDAPSTSHSQAATASIANSGGSSRSERAHRPVGGALKKENRRQRGRRPQRWRPAPASLGACSDVARRPLAQRAIIWNRRLTTATSPAALLSRYETARRACELNDWREEQLFLRLLQQRIDSRGAVRQVLQHFTHRPDVQRFVARLLMRRTVDTDLVMEVQRVLFGSAVNWDSVDRRLSEIADPQERLTKLRDYVAREPDDPRGQIRLVELLATNEQVEQALALGRRLRDRGLLTLPIARQLGDVLARHGLQQEAVRTYSEIVEFDPRNLQSRMLLGDIYLGHGWYRPAYRQYRTVADSAPNDPLAWLRLAGAAAGSGRIDEALRLERRVSTAQGRPGANDPRRWARLWSGARLARLLAEPPAQANKAPSRASLERKLKELQLFGAGTGTLVILSWEDLRHDLQLTTEMDGIPMALGDITDAAATGLAAVTLSNGQLNRVTLVASLRSVPSRDGINIVFHSIEWDGKTFVVNVEHKQLPAHEVRIAL